MNLLEDRRTIYFLITEFFPLGFKMTEGFENLDNILPDWVKDKVQKHLAEALNTRGTVRRKENPFLF